MLSHVLWLMGERVSSKRRIPAATFPHHPASGPCPEPHRTSQEDSRRLAANLPHTCRPRAAGVLETHAAGTSEVLTVRCPWLLCLLSAPLTLPLCAQEGWFSEPPAPGPSIHLTPDGLAAVETFASDRAIVGTYLFYWYCIYQNAHYLYEDGGDTCTTHPVSWEDYSFHSTRWWREQLRDISAAGIDFAAPVYWGCPGAYEDWSFQGLPHLVRALDYMGRLGEKHPKIALFYDTSTLAHNRHGRRVDLTTDDGKAWFYCTIRDFWSFIPPRHWAAIDGRPIVLLYAAAFAEKQDASLFPYVRERFTADFGVDPYLIKQTSWEGEADSTCEWGGALGLSLAGCAALGPGYDHAAVRGRTPLVREREDGAFYSRSWETLLSLNPARRPKLTMVETWNEFHEGTDIAHSLEYGRQYIELTAGYARLFHEGERLSSGATEYSDAGSVWATLGASGESHGLSAVATADGAIEPIRVGDRDCIRSAPTQHAARYLYFNVDEGFGFDLDPQPIEITIEYFDRGCEVFLLEYDSSDPDGSVRAGAFKSGGAVKLTGTETWKTAKLTLSDARFANRSNGADFRLAVQGQPLELCVARVEVGKGR